MIAPNHRPKTVFVTLLALGGGAFAIGLDAFVIIGVLSEIAADLAISTSLAGQLVALYALCYAIFAPLSAWLLGNFDRKTVILVSILLFALGNLICALSESYLMIVVGRIVSALGAASFTPVATTLASSLVPERRKGAALAVVFGGMTVAQAVGVPFATFVGQTFGWRVSFHGIAALGSITAILLAAMLRPVPPTHIQQLAARFRILRDVRILQVLTITFLVVQSEFVVYSYISAILRNTDFHGTNVLSVVLLFYGAGAVIGNIATGVLTDKLGPKSVLAFSVAVQTAMLVGLVVLRAIPEAAIAIGLLWGIVSYMYLVPIQHKLLALAPQSGSFVISLNSSVIYLGISAGGAAGGAALLFLPIESLAAVAVILGAAGLVLIGTSFSAEQFAEAKS